MGSNVTQQNALSAGEFSPALFGRTDIPKYKEGTSTCRNFFVDYRGGIQTRPGFQYVGTALPAGTGLPPRLIPFQFSFTQGYALEFGNFTTRFIFNGAYVTESTFAISAITQANPGVLTITGNNYSPGDWIYISGITGMTPLNGLTFIVHTVSGASVTLTDLFGNVVDTTSYPAYVSGGTTARIYTVTSPYAIADLPYLKYTQSADVMTLTCVNTATQTEYAPYDLKRLGNTNWTFTANNFAAVLTAPTNLTATAYSSSQLTTWYSYIVTAVDSKTGEESNPSAAVNVQNCDISIFAGSNSISWDAVANADSYNIYASTPSYGAQITAGNLYGFIGISFGTNFLDNNIQPDFTTVPPSHFNPFARGSIIDVLPTAGGANYSQSTIGYSVTTSTGSGFAGQPVVTNGALTGFVISNGGQLYAPTDTISFTDTGGGLATGTVTFSGQPADTNILRFNGWQVEFIADGNSDAAAPGPRQVIIANTVALTVQTLAEVLNAGNYLDWTVATYTANNNVLTITYKTPGTIGNSYTLPVSGSFSTSSGSNLTGGGTVGSGATATLTLSPATGTYPSVVSYFQQRRVYAGSLNQPDTYWMSQPGLFYNMDTSIPTTAADAITGTPWALQVNGIQWLVPMPGGMVTLTGTSAWQVNGGSSAAITASDQAAIPQAYNGCNPLVPPLRINYDILYVQAKGNRVRDLSYNWWIQIYTGIDLTTFSNHLFDGYQIVQWAWTDEPYKTIWLVRNDGTLLCLTYLKEGDAMGGSAVSVYSWTRHDTNGLFESVCSITEPPIDALYAVVKRYVQGAWRYYVERLGVTLGENGVTLQSNPETYICQDASLQTSLTYPNANLYFPIGKFSTTVTVTADQSVFTSANIGQVLRASGGSGTITAQTGTTATLTINSPFTLLIPNDPNGTTLPAAPNNWSLSTPITQVTGLNHLYGLQVSILADGGIVPNQFVSLLSPGVYGVTLPVAASYISVGLPFTAQAQTLYIDKQGEQTVQTKRKTISAVGLQLENTRGLQIGADQPDASTQPNTTDSVWTNMIELREAPVIAGQQTPLFTGTIYQTVQGGWRTGGQVALQQTYPLPAKVLAVTSYWTQGEDK